MNKWLKQSWNYTIWSNSQVYAELMLRLNSSQLLTILVSRNWCLWNFHWRERLEKMHPLQTRFKNMTSRIWKLLFFRLWILRIWAMKRIFCTILILKEGLESRMLFKILLVCRYWTNFMKVINNPNSKFKQINRCSMHWNQIWSRILAKFVWALWRFWNCLSA